MLDVTKAVLITPKNDPESLQIVRIARAAGLLVMISAQRHGAKLEKEEDLLLRVRREFPSANTLVIVEIPGPVMEEELRAAGYHVVIIDHHRYDHVDRMKPQSSLEQFLELFGFGDDKLRAWGFDPLLVRGVGMIDRGFLHELKKEGLSDDEQRKVRAYYRTLTLELGGQRAEEEAEAARAWKRRREQDGVIILESDASDLSIRDAVSFLAADEFDHQPEVLIYQPGRVAYVQDSDAVPVLHRHFGGFTFGQDRCWGFALDVHAELPTIDAILEVMRSSR
jgi:hypothetical protein